MWLLILWKNRLRSFHSKFCNVSLSPLLNSLIEKYIIKQDLLSQIAPFWDGGGRELSNKIIFRPMQTKNHIFFKNDSTLFEATKSFLKRPKGLKFCIKVFQWKLLTYPKVAQILSAENFFQSTLIRQLNSCFW